MQVPKPFNQLASLLTRPHQVSFFKEWARKWRPESWSLEGYVRHAIVNRGTCVADGLGRYLATESAYIYLPR
jgi:hypothetical protein